MSPTELKMQPTLLLWIVVAAFSTRCRKTSIVSIIRIEYT
jgi:hypothetical protein